MSELLCHTDNYVQDFAATVIAADTAKSAVVLDRTAFYPGGGGQPHDLGWLQTSGESLAVTKIARQGGQLWHTIAGALPAVGTAVHRRLDWERRDKPLPAHTALHVLGGGVWGDHNAPGTGGPMEPPPGPTGLEIETVRPGVVVGVET